MQAYLRGDPLQAVGIGLKASRRGPGPALALPVAPAAELEAALQAVLAEPKMAQPGAREAALPKAAAPPPALGARCDMPEVGLGLGSRQVLFFVYLKRRCQRCARQCCGCGVAAARSALRHARAHQSPLHSSLLMPDMVPEQHRVLTHKAHLQFA